MNNLSLVISNISIRQDSESRYCLNDLHNSAGNNENHRPSKFLRTDQTKALIIEIEQSPNMGFAIKSNVGGKGGSKTYACKELVYAYAMWISPSFSLKVIRAYDDLVNPTQTNKNINPHNLTTEQFKQIQDIINTQKMHIETQLLPIAQTDEIMQRMDRLSRLFNPMSQQFSDICGVVRILRGLHPKLGMTEAGYIRVMPDA